MKIVIICLFLVFSNISRAEIYKDFTPNLTISQIKNNYPNASFEVVKAAWVKNNEKFLKLQGTGILGTIYLAFSYSDEYWKMSKTDIEKKIADNPDLSNPDLQAKLLYYQNMIDRPLEDKLSLDWVRWIPPETLPFERLKSRYGEPEKCDFTTDDYIPYCNWLTKGVMATLSDDKKLVYAIEFNFTKEELYASWGIEIPKEDVKSITKEKKTKKKL